MCLGTDSKQELKFTLEPMTYKILAFIPSHSTWDGYLANYPFLWSCITHLMVTQGRHSPNLISPQQELEIYSPKRRGKVMISSPRRIRYPFSIAGGHGFSSPRQIAIHRLHQQHTPSAMNVSHFSSSINTLLEAWDRWDNCRLLSWSISKSIQTFTASVMLRWHVPSFILNPVEQTPLFETEDAALAYISSSWRHSTGQLLGPEN